MVLYCIIAFTVLVMRPGRIEIGTTHGITPSGAIRTSGLISAAYSWGEAVTL